MAKQHSNRYLFGITLVATLGGLLFGYDTAVVSGAEKSLEASNQPLGLNFDTRAIVSSALIGASSGDYFGFFANRIGCERR